MMVIKFVQSQCWISFLCTISKIQNIDHSQLIRPTEVV
ncbi:hypothetical protein MUK42_32397 [Musa troglodytarum]|uniref:Uncharacterized protein n=1 Tax=Musa troglodytarum TaxID=320322 RepID=A0A9E7F7D3_9LILI|nr:hypothetical protein MUK42_32397 [Musa troglodytarum]